MKKIIAAAVAGAFAVPAVPVFAEVTLSGEVEYIYRVEADGPNEITHNDIGFEIVGVEEVNGLTFEATLAIIEDEDNAANDANDTLQGMENDGSNLKVSGAFGSLTVGDTSGALDKVGDYTDMSPTGGGFAGDSDDHAMLYSTPVFNGIQVHVSHTPETVNVGRDTSLAADASGVSVEGSFGPVEAYYGRDTENDFDAYAYGVKVSVSGFTVAYEEGQEEDGGSAFGNGITQATANEDVEVSGIAASYKFGDVLVGLENQEAIEGGARLYDQDVYFVEYNLGSNVDVYAASIMNADDLATADNDETRVGVEFKF